MRALLSRICFVWFVFCGLRANEEQKEKRKKYASERESERTPTNQPSDAILCLFAKTSNVRSFPLSREVFTSPLSNFIVYSRRNSNTLNYSIQVAREIFTRFASFLYSHATRAKNARTNAQSVRRED